jgi:hypothetical protein
MKPDTRAPLKWMAAAVPSNPREMATWLPAGAAVTLTISLSIESCILATISDASATVIVVAAVSSAAASRVCRRLTPMVRSASVATRPGKAAAGFPAKAAAAVPFVRGAPKTAVPKVD